ncbi:YdcF family protein [Paenibacillus gansuensis]|uniref:YdcF family protein n=1 Tax=Paenibacillus gansuensis TaxID=306542 RepID=A0ABW5P7M7_9BACL
MDFAYIIKIIYTLMFPPSLLWLVLSGLAVYTFWKKRRRFGYVLLALSIFSYITTCSFTGYLLNRSLDTQLVYPQNIEGDVIIVLGEGASLRVQSVDDIGELQPNSALNVLVAMKLYRKLHVPILLSGGQGLGVSSAGNESDISRRYLLSMGVPERMILTDNGSRTTLENARASKRILEQEGFNRPILVASAFHMERAVTLFTEEGMNVLPVPSLLQPKVVHRFNLFDFIPSSAGSFAVQRGIKEMLGRLQHWFV